MSRLQTPPLALDALLGEDDPGAGALVLFAGTVREQNEGRPVSGLSYSAHEALADKLLAAIEAEALARYEIRSCRILHRLGALQLGDTSVLIAVRSAHRADAFEAARYAIEELKKRVPIFKEEHYRDGDSAWLPGTPVEN